MVKSKTYTLKIGEQAKERLLILNSVCNPFTLSLLKSFPRIKGKKILDLACGIGVMTLELGRLAGNHGRVLGVDISEEQLSIARQLAKSKNCKNIQYRAGTATNLNALNEEFDIVYCRFLLCHLRTPLKSIKEMIRCLKKDGLLILEEPTGCEPMFSSPQSATFDQCKRIHLLQGEVFKTDFTVGRKINHWFQKLQLAVEYDRLVQPLLKNEYEKRQLWLAVREIAPELIAKGLTTSLEIKRITANLKRYARNDKYQSAYVQYRQIVARNRKQQN